jgi:hypothetical protein
MPNIPILSGSACVFLSAQSITALTSFWVAEPAKSALPVEPPSPRCA